MNLNSKFFSIGKIELQYNHLLIFGILALSFSISFLLRSINGYFGWSLNEFDPFFNYRATEYIVNNGLNSYFNWNDDLSWYPNGRDVSQTSQVILHVFTAITYSLFNFGMNLYDYTIIFPVIVGSLTSVIIFAIVRLIYNNTAGLIASLLYAIAIPIIIRGTLGWFKSEPLGIFLGLIGVYFLLSGINSKKSKSSIIKILLSGCIITSSISAWGGDQFFIIVIGLFFLSLPFTHNDKKHLFWKISFFVISLVLTSFLFEKISYNFLNSMGIFIIGCSIFALASNLVQLRSKKYPILKGILVIIIPILTIILLMFIMSDNFIFDNVTYRYLNAINPLLTTTNPLIDSVAEHSTNDTRSSFYFQTILLIFGGVGIWLVLSKKNELKFIKNNMILFSLIFGFFGVYISSAFLRLELFASLGLIILSSISISYLIKNSFNSKKNILGNFLPLGIILLLIIPLIPFNIDSNQYSAMFTPPVILNGGSKYLISNSDWIDTLIWIKDNTPSESVIASWWDYGYWIQTISERATLSDNSTLSEFVIKNIAEILFMSPDDAWKSLKEKEVDYIVVFVSGERFDVNGNNGLPLYGLGGGGDESKKYWFLRIANLPLNEYLFSDQMSGTEKFWNETTLGQLIPFEIIGYVNLENQQQSLSYQPGFIGIYGKVNKLSDDDPFNLVYSSQSLEAELGQPFTGVLVYKINETYSQSKN